MKSEQGKAAVAVRLQRPESKEKFNACQRRYKSSERGKLLHQIRQQQRRSRKINNGGSGVSHEDWLATLAVYNERCAYCGDTENLTMDHVVPLFHGGHHSPENIVPACRHCNAVKHTSTDWKPRVFPVGLKLWEAG